MSSGHDEGRTPDSWDRTGRPGRSSQHRRELGLIRLEQALVDIEHDVRDLERRFAALTSLYERMARVALQVRNDSDSVGPEIESQRQPRARKSLLKRVVRRVIQLTLGTCRRIWQAAEVSPGPGEVECRVSSRRASRPRPWLVVRSWQEAGRQSGAGPRPKAVGEGRLLAALRAQTADGLCVVSLERCWSLARVEMAQGVEISVGDALEPVELAKRIGCGHVLLLAPRLEELEPTMVEQLQWLTRSERIDLIVCARAMRADAEMVVLPIRMWPWLVARCRSDGPRIASSDGGLLARVLVVIETLDRQRAVLGKLVSFEALGGQLGSQPDAAAVLAQVVPSELRRIGWHLVSRACKDRAVELEVSQLDVAASGGKAWCGRATLLLITEPLSRGLVHLAAIVVQLLGGESVIVAVLTKSLPGSARGIESLRRAGALVYEPPRFLASELWLSVAHRLACQDQVKRLVHIGDSGWWRGHLAWLQRQLDRQSLVEIPVAGVGRSGSWLATETRVRHLALSDRLLGVLESSGVPRDRASLCDGWRLALASSRGEASTQRREEIREALGVPDHVGLVIVVADLVAEQRPEEVVCLARWLETAPSGSEAMLLLVGEGPLAASVLELAAAFGLERFSLQARRHSDLELAMAADVACCLAETEPIPVWPMAAVVTGAPLVMTGNAPFAQVLELSRVEVEVIDPLAGLEPVSTAVRERLAGVGKRERRAVKPEVVRDLLLRGEEQLRRALEIERL